MSNAVRPDYPTGTIEQSIAAGAKTVFAFCGTVNGQKRCGHSAKLNIADLPRVTWREVCSRMRCPDCGVRGDVQIRFNHNEGYTARACNIIDGKIIPQ